MNNLFIREVKINWEEIADKNKYPFNIPLIRNMDVLKFNNNVTFLVGENGCGKSTILEAIALKYGINPEGGSSNFNFNTYDTHSNLSNYLTIKTSGYIPKTKYFLRAESFYNVASEIVKSDLLEYYKYINLHECSHGEAFLNLIKVRFYDKGLYILDEPESALSPVRQMTLLCLIDELSNKGAQFIIATHSPILISYRKGIILDLSNNFEEINYEDTEIYKTYKLFLDNPYQLQSKLFEKNKS